MIQRSIMKALGIGIVVVFVGAFPAMEWIRAQQGHSGQIAPSEIASLAIRPPSTDPFADARQRGEVVYQHYCAICHGTRGKADGLNASLLDITPRDFTSAKFWKKQTTPERLHHVVAYGGAYIGKSVLMPAWGNTLTESQINDVLTYLRTFPQTAQADASGN